MIFDIHGKKTQKLKKPKILLMILFLLIEEKRK